MKVLRKLLKAVKDSKGPATAKGKYIDYREAHKLQYAFFKGASIISPFALRNEIQARKMGFKAWEDSEGQYHDTALAAGYILSKLAVAGVSGVFMF